jgi:hypothetical protein
MGYKITFHDGKRVVCAKAWPCDLAAATAHAKAQLPVKHAQHGATSVTVTCERTGEVLVRFEDEPLQAKSI